MPIIPSHHNHKAQHSKQQKCHDPGGGIGVDASLLVESIEDMLRERQFAGPAVALLMHFPGLQVISVISHTTGRCSTRAGGVAQDEFAKCEPGLFI